MHASWCSAKKQHSHSATLAFNHNITQTHGRSQSRFPQRQTIAGNCSQKSHRFLQRTHPNSLAVSRSKRWEQLLCSTSRVSEEVLISWCQCLAGGQPNSLAHDFILTKLTSTWNPRKHLNSDVTQPESHPSLWKSTCSPKRGHAVKKKRMSKEQTHRNTRVFLNLSPGQSRAYLQPTK